MGTNRRPRGSTENILAYCDQIDALTECIRIEVQGGPTPPDPPDVDVVPIGPGDDLQAALENGGLMVLEAGADFTSPSGFMVNTTPAYLRGQGQNVLRAEHEETISIPPGVESVRLENFEVAVQNGTVGVLIGRNDSAQTDIGQVPMGVVVRKITSQSLRGKRAIEVNGGDVEIHECEVRDLYSPVSQDSQAICILNTPGPVLVDGGYYEAASENILVGGDQMKIPGVRPSNLTFRHLTLFKPLEWKTAGVPVKNIFELKDGHNVLIEDCTLQNCWKSGQDGYGFMLTPTRGGSLRGVVIRNCQMRDVGGIVNITGIDTNYPNEPRTQIDIIGGDFRTNKTQMGGSGRFCLIGRGPEYFRVEGANIVHEGSAFIDCSDKSPIDTLSVRNCNWNYGSYGIRIGGYNHGDNQLGIIRTITIEGNVISGAHSQFRERYPNNTYTALMSREREREVDEAPYVFEP